jgi:hypothetical protein
MSSHYPLNGVDLDFRRYAHRPLGARDIFVSRVMNDFFDTRRVSPRTYLNEIGQSPQGFGPFKSQDRELGLDLQVLWRLLRMAWPDDMTVTFERRIIELVQGHYFKCHPLVHQAIRSLGDRTEDPRTASGWKQDMVSHLALSRQAYSVHHRYSVFSGSCQLPFDHGPRNAKISLGPCFLAVPWADHGPKWPRSLKKEARRSGYLTMPKSSALVHETPSRSQSLPAEGSWGIASSCPKYDRQADGVLPYAAFFPLKSLSELDKASRRRSLSRSHIRAMFTDKPEWIIPDASTNSPRAPLEKHHPCSNCAQYTHATKNCPSYCGYCFSSEHKAHNCTLKAGNRCKCRPFPQFHRASQCHVRCSRRCGSPYPPGHFKHINAMMCSHRCCMCGIKGHSGRKCSLKKCPCGERHLAQDCRWKVECAAEGCDYYLCSLHCRECGKKRGRGSQNAFVGRTCQDCLKNGISISARTP